MAHPQKHLDLSDLDSPELAEDVLNRDNLAMLLARGLAKSRSSESLITGIYAPWGSGKTWLKHRILKYLKARPERVTIIEFSPWQIRGVDELVLQFFSQIFDRLGDGFGLEHKENLNDRRRFWGSLARISGVGTAILKLAGPFTKSDPTLATATSVLSIAMGITKAFGESLAKADTKETKLMGADEIRAKLGNLFRQPHTPEVLIVIDDVDRMAADEIQALIRVIKANANFVGLNYLLLCDPNQVAAALDPIASGKGAEYLEKIVQNPVRLPKPGSNAIFRQLAKGLQQIASRRNYPFEPNAARLQGYFTNFLSAGLLNLRTVYRLLEALDFSASVLTNDEQLEVDLVDLLAVDFLRLQVPELADWIQLYGPDFYAVSMEQFMFDKTQKKPFIDVLPKVISERFGLTNAFLVLTTLFPKTEAAFTIEKIDYLGGRWRAQDNSKTYLMAVADEEHFESYFRLQPLPSKVPTADYEAAMRESNDAPAIQQAIERWITNDQLASALKRIEAELDQHPQHKQTEIAMALVFSSDKIEGSDISWALRIAFSVLSKLADREKREFLSRVFSQLSSLSPKLFILGELRKAHFPEKFENRKIYFNLPSLSNKEFSALLRAVDKESGSAILHQRYFAHFNTSWRIWRWQQGLGIAFTERFLSHRLAGEDLESVYRVAQAIAQSCVNQYDMDFCQASHFDQTEVFGIAAELEKFASLGFWKKFAQQAKKQFPRTESPQDGIDCLVQYILRWTSRKPKDADPKILPKRKPPAKKASKS